MSKTTLADDTKTSHITSEDDAKMKGRHDTKTVSTVDAKASQRMLADDAKTALADDVKASQTMLPEDSKTTARDDNKMILTVDAKVLPATLTDDAKPSLSNPANDVIDASTVDAETDDLKTTFVDGWNLVVGVVDVENSDVLTTFVSLDPPPLLKPKNNKYFRAGTLFKIPGIPARLDSISHLARTDASSDANFYAEPRLVTHIDADAIDSLRNFYRRHLKNG
jgi:hypothetical protein